MTSDSPNGNVIALLMAAGQSRRFGNNDKRKAQLPGGQPLLVESYQRIATAFPQTFVVLQQGEAPESFGLSALTSVIAAPHAQNGLGASLADAFRAINSDPSLADVDAVAVCLGDMPLVSSATLTALAHASSAHTIIRPALQGNPGHPVIIGRRFWDAMTTLAGDEGGKKVLQENRVHLVLIPVTDPGVLTDADTPEQLRNLTLKGGLS